MEQDTLRQGPLDKIPWEVLLCIAVHLPDLPSVFNLDQAFPTFAVLFNRHGAEILESAMETSLPIETRGLIRLTAYLRGLREGDGEPILSLNSFVDHHMFSRPTSRAVLPLPRDASPSRLRGILATAVKIEALAMACLAEFMRRCLALHPAHLVDKTFEYKSNGHGKPDFDQEPAGWAYQPHSSGPPSWLERHTTLRALWFTQMFVDLAHAVSRRRIGWVDEKFAAWKSLQIGRLGLFLANAQEYPVVTAGWWVVPRIAAWHVFSVVDYLEDIGWTMPVLKQASQENWDPPVRLPRPPEAEEPFDWHRTGTGPYPGCDEPFESHPLEMLGGDPTAVECFVHSRMNRYRRSPVFGVETWDREVRKPSPFRRLGLFLWDSRRLMALELLGPPEPGGGFSRGWFKYFGEYDLYFTWKSLLTPQQVAAQRRGAEELTWYRRYGRFQHLRSNPGE